MAEKDGLIYSKANSNIKRGDVIFSMPLGLCLDVSKAVTKFGPLTTKLRTGMIIVDNFKLHFFQLIRSYLICHSLIDEAV